MTTLSTSPIYPAAGFSSRLTFGLTESGSGSNFVRVWVTAAPVGSEERKQLDAAGGTNRVEFYADLGDQAPKTFLPVVGGKYTFVAQEYTRASRGGYERDPSGAGAETKVGTEATLTLHVGQRVTQATGTDSNRAEIVFWVWDDTVRRTFAAQHGEDSPRITAQNPSDRSRAAMESSTVVAALTALIDQDVDDVIGDPAALISNFHTRWNAHVASASFHGAADSDNALLQGLATASSLEGLVSFVNKSLEVMRRHYTNDDGTGPDSAGYHDVSGKVHDWDNMPLFTSVQDPSQAYVGFAELHRSYELHRADTGVHDSADTTALSTLPLLMSIHEAFLQVLGDATTAAPPAQSDGVMKLIQVAGCKESPLS